MGLFSFAKKKTTNTTKTSNVLGSLTGAPKKRCLRNQKGEYIHENTTTSSHKVRYTTDIGEAKQFDSDEEAVYLLRCLLTNRAMAEQEVGNMNFVDILGTFSVEDDTINEVSMKPKKEKPLRCLIF